MVIVTNKNIVHNRKTICGYNVSCVDFLYNGSPRLRSSRDRVGAVRDRRSPGRMQLKMVIGVWTHLRKEEILVHGFESPL